MFQLYHVNNKLLSDDDVCFAQDHYELDFHIARTLNQKSVILE
jgi:hypothetical protein